jgi:hypothetical protein
MTIAGLLRKLAFSVLVTTAGCNVAGDPCYKVECLNFGLCADGLCVCPAGFEGEVCGELVSNRLAGTRIGERVCNDIGPTPITVSITAGEIGVTDIILTGLPEEGGALEATLISSGLNIPAQEVTFNGETTTLSGSGIIRPTELFIYFSMGQAGPFARECNVTLPL